jgi:hypothetical protein
MVGRSHKKAETLRVIKADLDISYVLQEITKGSGARCHAALKPHRQALLPGYPDQHLDIAHKHQSLSTLIYVQVF